MEPLSLAAPERAEPDLGRVTALAGGLVQALAGAVRAPETALRGCVACLLAGGHLMIEDVPGVGKTLLAKAIARATGGAFARLQCTSDLLPADVTGVHVWDQRRQDFSFRPGPVFANVVLVDEINRASPKTQSALLECMEEDQVTVDGETRGLPRPFMVVATLNPVEYEGTFPLPEAQLDRFAMRISLGYPEAAQEAAMLLDLAVRDPLEDVPVVADPAEIAAASRAAGAVHVHPSLSRYVVALAAATRADRRLRLGASPRAALTLLRVAKATALVDGAGYLLPEHVKAVAPVVLAHRLVVATEARARGIEAGEVLAEALSTTPVPI